MGFFKDKGEPADATKPLRVVEEISEAVAAPSEEPEDRSAYNCDACGGDGLVFDESIKKDVLCPRCLGTGKL